MAEAEPFQSGGLVAGPMFAEPDTCTLVIPVDAQRRFEAIVVPAIRSLNVYFDALGEQLRPLVAAFNEFALCLPKPPVRGRPLPLAVDGRAYRRRCLARRRRR